MSFIPSFVLQTVFKGLLCLRYTRHSTENTVMANTISAYYSVGKQSNKNSYFTTIVMQTRATMGVLEQSWIYPTRPLSRAPQFVSSIIAGIPFNPVLRVQSLHIMGPQDPSELVLSQVTEIHSLSSVKDVELQLVPSPRGICILKRIITSAKGKVPLVQAFRPKQEEQRVSQRSRRLPSQKHRCHSGEAGCPPWALGRSGTERGLETIWQDTKQKARGEQPPEPCFPGLAFLSSPQAWTCFLLSSWGV